MRPTTDEEHIGIEIECLGTITRDELREALNEVDGLRGKTDVGYDLSIEKDEEDQNQHEVRILCTRNNRKDLITKVMKVLNDNECSVNESCSIHVHLDLRNKSMSRVRTVFYNLVKCSELMFSLQEDHRRNSTYCETNRYETYTGTLNRDTGNNARRRAINAHSYRRFSTLEIRLHHGSLDADEVLTFIKLLLKVKGKRRRLTTTVETVEQLKQYVTKDTRLLASMKERWEEYNDAA